jgi:hypothetical protein
VALSLLLPFALIELGDVAFEDGNTTEAEIESCGQTADDEPIGSGENREVHDARAYKTIVSLRAKIAGILEGFWN